MASDDPDALRDYGLPNPTGVLGTPTWVAAKEECPNCGGLLCAVKVRVAMPLLKGGEGTSNYLGCPACPYASPALMVADSGT